MQIQLNGEHFKCPANCTVSGLLELMNLGNKRVAVERNGAIVPMSQHGSSTLTEGDTVEVVRAIGGGQ